MPKNPHAVELGKRGGKIGGRSCSKAKRAASRKNGALGGRPKKIVKKGISRKALTTPALRHKVCHVRD